MAAGKWAEKDAECPETTTKALHPFSLGICPVHELTSPVENYLK